MASGLTQRKRINYSENDDHFDARDSATKESSASVPTTTSADDFDDADDGKGLGAKQNKLTILEEVLLLGLNDSQGYLSFWNDNISYVLRGCIVMELSLRGRISTVKEVRKRPYADRLIEVVDERNTGEVLLDEALKLMKLDQQSIGNWIDLMSGETWNLLKIGYQLKQVRERIAKGLVDKGVLRTEKRNFVLFDMATHPVADHTIKEQIVQRCVDALLGRGPPPDKRTIALVCAAYAANVLENALSKIPHSQRETAFQKVDEILQEHAALTEKAKSLGTTEVVAGVFSVFTKMDSIFDPNGKLNFAGKAVLHAEGVDFGSGQSYQINMDQLLLGEELGKGQYGTVRKVFHTPTNVTMAMKEIRLELDPTKLKQILMELDVLHLSQSPYIIEFYGAFFIESCVYYCMEYMDAGSVDKLYTGGVPEDILGKIAYSMVLGLKFLKDELVIMHRDVKPTNVLVNLKGEVKLCDFGVSGQLIASKAITNIGCQSYMAPERISVQEAGMYTVQSDIWSLGLSLIEIGIGCYPYPKAESMFAQLNAIISGKPQELPADKFSPACRDFVERCLNKDASKRPTYGELIEHPWLNQYATKEVDVAGWARKKKEMLAHNS
ncbi:hypothetical protein HK098_005103 [Nowakowskiella sp. JEL0407]|nr:hypothetical protein HK098_005103 [Nowakowskiella sp. JEL0407]